MSKNDKGITRKQFLRGAALGVAAIGAAGIAPKANAGLFGGSKKEKWDETLDTIIVGSGFAGLAAAIKSKENGAVPVVLEKRALIGGNSVLSTAWLNAAETSIQREKFDIKNDSHKLHYQDTLKGGDYKNDKDLVKALTDNVTESVEWLKGLGAPFAKITMLGGASRKRSHAPSNEYGGGLVKLLYSRAKTLGIEFRKKTKVIDFVIREDEKTGKRTLEGVVVESGGAVKRLKAAKAVIIASGGFGANAELVKRYDPSLVGYETTNFKDASTGEVMIAAMENGADAAGINYVQIHPTFSNTPGKNNILITEGLRGEGFILVNTEAKRFVQDLDRRDVVSAAILSQPNKYAYLIGSKETYHPKVEAYKKSGLVFEAETLAEVAEKAKLNSKVLAATVSEYNGYVKARKDPVFARKNMEKQILTGPFYAIRVKPAIHHTMGGVRINTKGQVLDLDGNVIRGMYAAGECTGGIHGTNRLGGNAVADCLTFGRIAAENASKEQA